MDAALSDAIKAIYACAARPADWPETLRTIAQCFDDVGALLLYRRDDGSFRTIVSPNLEPFAEAYHSKWWRHDIRAARSLDYAYRDHVGAITDRHGVTDEEIETHPIYTEFLAPLGLRWVAGVQVLPQSGMAVALSVHRAPSKPPYSDEELALLTLLGQHVEQALRLSLRLIDAETVGLGLGDSLGRLAIGAFVLGDDGRVVFANSRAEAMLSHAFVVKGGVLTCRSPVDQKRLTALLAHCGQISQDAPPQRTVAPFVIEDGPTRLAVYALPLTAGTAPAERLLTGGRTILLAVAIAAGEPVDPGLLRDVCGLTLGEARVASLIANGLSPSAAADRLNLAENTVRSVLKRVFDKLDVSRQSELAALLSSLKAAEARADAGRSRF